MSKIVETNKKIAETVVEGYKKIETGVVDGYKKVEDAVVGTYKKVEDGFVEKHLVKEGETVEEAKSRLTKEHGHVEVNIPDSSEIVKRNFEASKNAGKR